MDQSAAPASPVPPITNPPATSPVQPKTNFFDLKNKTTLAMIGGFFLVLILGLILVLSQGPKKTSVNTADPNQPTDKTWELTVSFDAQKKALNSKSLTLLDQNIRPDPRTTNDSSYTLYLLNKSNQILYKSKVNITEQFLVDFLPGTATSSAYTIPSFDSIIYFPDYPSATNIKITKDSTLSLDIKIPAQTQKSSMLQNLTTVAGLLKNLLENQPSPVFAQTSTNPNAVQIVFISDGFSDMNQFHQLVDSIKARYNSTAPYSSANPSIFDFETVDNTQPLGCSYYGIMYCAQYNQGLIYQLGYGHFPHASKLVVINYSPNAQKLDGGTLGLANDIGGNVAIVTNRPDASQEVFLRDATHEVLGHALGELYDRYVAPPPYPGLAHNIKSNCTDNSHGEAFWSQAGEPGAFAGCGTQTLYAPIAPSCQTPGSSLISDGTPNSVMSAAGCGTPIGFDLVEQWWIKDFILPRYEQPVTASPSPIASPSPQPSPSIVPVSSPSQNPNPAPSNTVSAGTSGNCPAVVLPPTNESPLPVIETISASSASTNSATVVGNVVSIAGGNIRVRGVQFYDQATGNCSYAQADLGQYNTGTYQRTITGLVQGHTYLIRAYAVNDNNLPGYDVSVTGYGQWISFTFLPANESSSSNGAVSQENGSSTALKTLTCTQQQNGVYTCQEN